jgi:hypothetical protein
MDTLPPQLRSTSTQTLRSSHVPSASNLPTTTRLHTKATPSFLGFEAQIEKSPSVDFAAQTNKPIMQGKRGLTAPRLEDAKSFTFDVWMTYWILLRSLTQPPPMHQHTLACSSRHDVNCT